MREDWEYKTFGEIGSFLRGKNIQKADFVSGGLPCIHYGQIHTKFDISIDYHLSEIPQEVYDKAIIASPGDVIIAITSEDIDGSCKSVVWLGNYDIAVSAHAAILKHNMNGKFIAYYLRSNTFFTQKLKYARGFKVMEIKTKDLAKLVLPIPPKPTQLSIVSELDKLNELIRIKKEQLKDYDALAQSIFYEMFGDPVVNEKGWEVKTFGECFSIGAGGTPSTKVKEYWDNGTIPWIGSNMCQNCIITETDGKFITEEGLTHSSTKLLAPGTVLVALVGATIGKVGLLRIETCTNQNVAFIKVQETETFTSEFVYYHLMGLYGEFMKIGQGNFKMANQGFIKLLPISLPPLPLQHSFAQKIEQIEQQKAAIQKTITDLETLLAARMQYWFD
jgi:type I restriction modification enzyme